MLTCACSSLGDKHLVGQVEEVGRLPPHRVELTVARRGVRGREVEAHEDADAVADRTRSRKGGADANAADAAGFFSAGLVEMVYDPGPTPLFRCSSVGWKRAAAGSGRRLSGRLPLVTNGWYPAGRKICESYLPRTLPMACSAGARAREASSAPLLRKPALPPTMVD